MTAQKPIIMYDAPEAASLKTVTGWVSADGRFFGAHEDLARYSSATHRRCGVNSEHQIYSVNSHCVECHQTRHQAKFAAMPIKDWTGEPLAILDSDQYFFDEDGLHHYLIDSDIDLAEDGEISDDQLVTAFDLLNEMIRNAAPLSWSQGEFAARLPQSFVDEVVTGRAKQ